MSTTAAQGSEGPAGQQAGQAGHQAGQAPQAPPAASGPGRWRGRLAWVAVTAVVAVLLYWAYLHESRLYATNSDGAAGVLMGWDMLHGNLLLRGWWTADVSFYTFEIPLDALSGAVRGLNVDTAHVTAAICYTALLIAAALLARGTARGRAGVIRALVTAGILLAPGGDSTNGLLLGSPDHIGVSVPIALSLLLVDRARPRWRVPVIMGVILVWAQLDDPMAEFAAAFAVAVVCLARAGLGLLRHRDAGWRDPGLRGCWYDAALGVAAVVSYVVTQIVVGLIWDAGGYSMRGLNQIARLVPVSRWGAQTVVAARNVMILFGADFYDQHTPAQTAISVLHLVGLALAVCGVLIGIAGLVRRGDRVTQCLTIGTLVTLGAGAYGSDMTAGYAAHEIAVVLPYGAILAGRAVGPWLARQRTAGQPRASAWQRTAAGALLPVLGVAGLCYAASLGYYAAQPAVPSRTQNLADWLTAHHMTTGLGKYWAGACTTASSGGRVLVLPMGPDPAKPYPWITRPGWYNPDRYNANFVVAGTDPANGMQYTPAKVRATFGPPAREYRFSTYVIMVYNRNLLRQTMKPFQPRADRGLQL